MSIISISADIHFCKRESLVDNRYQFLSNSIAFADTRKADLHFDLGDFFNSSTLSAEDVAVLESIKFKNSWHCLTGNHEQDGTNSLLKYFRDIHVVYETPCLKNFGKDVGWVMFIPFSKSPQPLDQLLRKLPNGEQVLVMSHCDFVGMFGAVAGYSIEEIESDSRIKMWFNGHYHNRAILGKKTVVVGNLLGKNFTQNMEPHGVCVYDTNSNEFHFEENPYALRFGKMDTSEPGCRDIRKLVQSDQVRRYVLAIKTQDDLRDAMKEWASAHLVASRVLSDGVGGSGVSQSDASVEELAIDHIGLFFKEVSKRFGEDIANDIQKN